MTGFTEAAAAGALPNLDAVMHVRQSETSHGRAIDIRVLDGIDLRLLPDRGLDIGAAWFAGKPLAWISQVGETGPLPQLDNRDWTTAFGGGLITTCGLRNVGMPSEGHGLHGTFSHLPARDVMVRTSHSGVVAVTCVVDDKEDPSPLRVQREITTIAGSGRIELTDVTTNVGDQAADAPLLYHLNFGYPLWGNGANLDIATTATTARDPDSERALDSWQRPPLLETGPESVLEHEVVPIDGWGRATIRNENLGIAITARWRLAELPRLHQWLDPNPGMAVLGIEPANCSTGGRAYDRAAGRLPSLEPGEARETRLVIHAERL
jgi:hypothetical protein